MGICSMTFLKDLSNEKKKLYIFTHAVTVSGTLFLC